MTTADVRRIDPQGMYDAVRSFPEQWQAGREAAHAVDPGFTVAGKQQVVVAGMGGSAIGGDFLRVLAVAGAALPVSVVRGYTLPASVDERAVLIASSYSGNTEETLSVLEEALARGVTVACVAAGGRVAEIAATHGLPLVPLTGGLQPRAALGYSFTAVLSLAEKIGLVEVGEAAWSETHALLAQRRDAWERLDGNAALDLAEALVDRLPFVYTGNGLLEAVGLRWRTQIHENAKMLATGNVFPELNHNEIMGWAGTSPLYERVGVVVLRDRDDHPQVHRRMDVTHRLLADRAGFWTDIESEGDSPLARMLSLAYFGDWVSLYLALLRGVDPTPVDLIQDLKRTLAG